MNLSKLTIPKKWNSQFEGSNNYVPMIPEKILPSDFAAGWFNWKETKHPLFDFTLFSSIWPALCQSIFPLPWNAREGRWPCQMIAASLRRDDASAEGGR